MFKLRDSARISEDLLAWVHGLTPSRQYLTNPLAAQTQRGRVISHSKPTNLREQNQKVPYEIERSVQESSTVDIKAVQEMRMDGRYRSADIHQGHEGRETNGMSEEIKAALRMNMPAGRDLP